MENRTITCVYCGHEYPKKTPASGVKVLTDHIKICEKHPMREAESKILKLRNALIGLVGSGNKEELERIEANIRLSNMTAPDKDKVNAINAIHAIIDTEK